MIRKNNNLIERKIFSRVTDHLSEKEMTVVIGPRQVGKTTLLEQIGKYLIDEQKVNPDSLFYFNLDLTRDLDLFSSQEKIINFIESRKRDRETMYLFIDEVQRIENARGCFWKVFTIWN